MGRGLTVSQGAKQLLAPLQILYASNGGGAVLSSSPPRLLSSALRTPQLSLRTFSSANFYCVNGQFEDVRLNSILA